MQTSNASQKRGKSAPLCQHRLQRRRRITDLSNGLIKDLGLLLTQYQFMFVLNPLYYCRRPYLCGPILPRVSWWTSLCRMLQAFNLLFVMLHRWWTLRPFPLRPKIYLRKCPLVSSRRHLSR